MRFHAVFGADGIFCQFSHNGRRDLISMLIEIVGDAERIKLRRVGVEIFVEQC